MKNNLFEINYFSCYTFDKVPIIQIIIIDTSFIHRHQRGRFLSTYADTYVSPV